MTRHSLHAQLPDETGAIVCTHRFRDGIVEDGITRSSEGFLHILPVQGRFDLLPLNEIVGRLTAHELVPGHDGHHI